MRGHQSQVVKIGGSILRGPDGLAQVAGRFATMRQGPVVLVTSALHGVTDRLERWAQRVGGSGADPALLATGEEQAVQLLAHALRWRGLRVCAVRSDTCPIVTDGDVTDAHPRSVDVPYLRTVLRTHDAVIVPGFVGRNPSGRATVFGRGGSDLSALFLARQLGVPCRLVKDVAGVYDQPPPLGRRFTTLHWNGLASLPASPVQPRAARFAARHRLAFRVEDWSGTGTDVGAGPSVLASSGPRAPPLPGD